MNKEPKIKLLIPIEIKDGCELPEAMKNCDHSKCVTGIINGEEYDVYYSHKHKQWINDFIRKVEHPTHWIMEIKTDLTIEQLKKLGVI